MTFAELSIKRPIFITSIVILTLTLGWISMKRMPIDQYPNVVFPYVAINTQYPGAGPAEMETLITKPLETYIGSIPGVKKMRSINYEGLSLIIVEFTLETDSRFAEVQVRDRISLARPSLPKEIKEPYIRRFDPSDQPIVTLALQGEASEKKLFDVADDQIKKKLEQIDQVSSVDIFGGREREIQIRLDRDKLREYEIAASQVANQLALSGENIPSGSTESSEKEVVYRTMGEFTSLENIRGVIVKFLGNDVPVTIGNLGEVVDSLKDEKTRAFLNGKKSLFINVYRQSGANTVAVADSVKKRLESIKKDLAVTNPELKLIMTRDGAKPIRDSLDDVKESIILGVILAVIVVFFFLANVRSTFITGLALPNSLIGSFIFIGAFGFSVNSMTLLALSLAVGLLVDDAIVVRENIFRHMESGEDPESAAVEGTREVQLAVIATTLTIISVFGPIAFVSGLSGRFLREFGLTICFAMLISLFDALTIAPMLSAYLARGRKENASYGKGWLDRVLAKFDAFQDQAEKVYERVLRYTLSNSMKVILMGVLAFVFSLLTIPFIPKTFLPTADTGELVVALNLDPGASLEAMQKSSFEIDELVRKNPEVSFTSLTVGDIRGGSNEASIYVQLVPGKKRSLTTTQVKQKLRDELKSYSYANPRIKDYDVLFGGLRPFSLNLIGSDSDVLDAYAKKVMDRLKSVSELRDLDLSSKPGKPELRVVLDENKRQSFGISSTLAGQELRTQIEGVTPAKFRESGHEYDVRVRLKDNQRRLEENFGKTLIPNMNFRLINLEKVATAIAARGPSVISRTDRSRYVQISADLASGAGLGNVISNAKKILEQELPLPVGVKYEFAGQGEQMEDMKDSMTLATVLAIVFIYLVLASLYESFITPISIMLALPLAVCGALVGLWIGRQSLDIFSIISCIMLLGIATKNSILLVDRTQQLINEGKNMKAAILEAGKTRLRPILMTSMALIAGTLPLAVGLNEASKQRTSMGYAIIGGVISSTLLTLVIVPAMYSYVEFFRKRMFAIWKFFTR